MKPKPAHLGIKYAMQFQDESIVEVYHHRSPYLSETINSLLDLITDTPRTVLDVGCASGDIARRLPEHVERVDAVDFSQAMIAKGKPLPGGDHPNLNWTYGRIEEVALQPPYALITAGSSLHWMEWDIVLPLFQRILTPHGYLALVDRGDEKRSPWDAQFVEIVRRYSTNQEYQPFNLVEELEQRHLFVQEGSIRTQPIPFTQSVEDFIRSIHSMNGFSRQRMGEAAASAFDEEVRTMLTPYQQDGFITQSLVDSIVWGKPVSF